MILQKQVEWAVVGGANYIIGQTFNCLGGQCYHWVPLFFHYIKGTRSVGDGKRC